MMQGVDWENPNCIRTCQEMIDWIREVGFLPLFRNGAAGFSVEEPAALAWWTGDEERDPWEWRRRIVRYFPQAEPQALAAVLGG